MTDYQHVWGSTQKGWSFHNYRKTQLLTTLTVFAWLGMVAFFVVGLYALFTGSDGATIAVGVSLFVWLAPAIAAIRIRRGRRRFLRILPSNTSRTSR
jgi:hypothetical protein